MTEWLEKLKTDVPINIGVSSPGDLARMSRKFTALKDRVDKKEDFFRTLNDQGNDLLLLHQSESSWFIFCEKWKLNTFPILSVCFYFRAL